MREARLCLRLKPQMLAAKRLIEELSLRPDPKDRRNRKPALQSTTEPTTEPTTKPAAEPVTQPATAPATQSATDSAVGPSSGAVNEPAPPAVGD